ncbi:MAG: hypothetical protein K5869_01010 [Saccharofermentans sp.]|nr:hypothetical protein [Saccharofermentans sp.]
MSAKFSKKRAKNQGLQKSLKPLKTLVIVSGFEPLAFRLEAATLKIKRRKDGHSGLLTSDLHPIFNHFQKETIFHGTVLPKA